MPAQRRIRRLVTPMLTAVLLSGGLALLPGSSSAVAPAIPGGPIAGSTAPAFLVPVSARGRSLPAPRSVTGPSSLVTLRTSLLPRRADGQAIRLDLGRQTVTGRFTHVERSRFFTAWTGSLDVDLGSFTIVRSGSEVRASFTWPQGLWTVTRARGSSYWLTQVAPGGAPSGDDVVRSTGTAHGTDATVPRTAGTRSKRGPSRIDVLFGYTPSAMRVAGSKAAVKAAVGQAAADTNTALRNSGIDAQLRVKGIVRVKGHESNNVIKDMRRLQRPHDGTFDGALRARSKHHADIVHLFTGGPSDQLCGAGAEPRTVGEAGPSQGASTSYISCLPYLVATHELGHNFGADHILYPGVSHYSRIHGAYAWYDVPHHFITALGYYDPCQDVGDFTCVRLPYYSNPTGSFFGFAIGSKDADNAKVIKKFAPIVARYSR